MTNTKRILVAGAGLIGARHARLVSDCEETVLAAIVDPAPTAKDLADELCAAHFPELQHALDGGIQIDGVIIATPNHTHADLFALCCERKIPCLIEKPLAATSKDARTILRMSANEGVPVLVGHHRRHHAISRQCMELINGGVLGRIVAAQCTWMLRKHDSYFETGAWRTKSGGGPVWINLIHEIDLLRSFLGEVAEVGAMTANATRSNDVEDTASISLRFESGALVSVIISDATPSPWHFEGASAENPNIAATGQDGLRIFGTRGALSFPSMTLWQHQNVETGNWGEPIHSTSTGHQSAMTGEAALTNQLTHLCDVISGKADALVNARDGLQNILVAEAILEAANTGRVVQTASAD